MELEPAHWQMGRVVANGLEDQGSIPGRVIPKTLKMVLDTSLLNTLHYKVHIKGKGEKSRERSSVLFAVVAIEKEAFWSPLSTVSNFTYLYRNWIRRHEFKSWTDCISHSPNTFGKGMNSIILPPVMGK